MKKQPIRHGEDGRVGTDADRERQNGCQRKKGITPKHPRRVKQVLPESIRELSCSDVSHVLHDDLDPAEFETCGTTSIFHPHSGSNLLVDQEVESRSYFVVEVLFDVLAMHEVPPQTSQARHELTSAESRFKSPSDGQGDPVPLRGFLA
jgi:hypothetical protein